MIISKPLFLNIVWKVFLSFLDCGPLVFLETANPSSLYSPILLGLYLLPIKLNMKITISSHTSAPSYDPIVISKLLLCCLIHGSPSLLFADKTSNKYRLEKEEHLHLLQNAETKNHIKNFLTYKKSNKETERRINCEGIKYAKEANIQDEVEVNGTANCFVTLKDHRENFLNHPTTRLINPAKNEIERISKEILDQINSKVCEILKVS